MDILVYNLPVNDAQAVDKTALTLISAERNGQKLSDEQKDWLDYANNYILIHSQGSF